ncbi:MAG: DUF1150 family protein [Alphaproteobacteria bacterium]|nr:DUF1150 family protein [Alphaproteobacteria bacterium]
MTPLDMLRRISPTELAQLGMQEIAYVKTVEVDGRLVQEVHAADGTTIGVMDDRDVAFAAVRQHDLEPVSVH